jgi:hypothetical protein
MNQQDIDFRMMMIQQENMYRCYMSYMMMLQMLHTSRLNNPNKNFALLILGKFLLHMMYSWSLQKKGYIDQPDKMYRM